MKLLKINSQNYINPRQVLSVAFLPDKLKTIVICQDKLMIESDYGFDETVSLINGEISHA